jgi:hypothetical protein
MADKKITELPDASLPLNDADLLEVVQGGVNKKAPKSAVGDSVSQDLTVATASTASGTITLDMDSDVQKMFVGSASFSTPKTMALSNTTNALVFTFLFTITDLAATLTWPSAFTMQEVDARWNTTSNVFTATATGTLECSATTYDAGTTWRLKISHRYV